MQGKRRIHLGIDYGTSASKIVFRDYGAPGDEKAFLVPGMDRFEFPLECVRALPNWSLGTTAERRRTATFTKA